MSVTQSFKTSPTAPSSPERGVGETRLLQKKEIPRNARRTNRAIAEAVHVAPSTSLERIRSLRERGVIRGYYAEAITVWNKIYRDVPQPSRN